MATSLNLVATRLYAVDVARSFIGTPYRLRHHMKGYGVDCGTLLAEYLIEIGRARRVDFESIGFYAQDWFCHTTEERYLRHLIKFGKLIADTIACNGIKTARPGQIALFRVVGSRLFNHGAIITHWPYGVHAQADGVREVNLAANRLTASKAMELRDPFQGVSDGAL